MLVTSHLAPIPDVSQSAAASGGRGPEWRSGARTGERGGSLENWLRPGGAAGWALPSNIGRQWAKREREAGRGLVHTPGTEPQSAQFLGRLEPISILLHKRLSFIS